MPALFVALGLASAWILWRLLSQRTVLPCPSELSWLVELQNPLARATRSADIVRQLAPQRGQRVVDIGCGPGRVTLPLARAIGSSGEVIALDLQPAMLAKVAAKAHREGLTQIRLLQSSAKDASLHEIDAAVMVMALGEIPDRTKTLRSLFAALKPGGRLLVGESVFDPHFIRRSRLRALAQSAGFSECSCRGNVFGYAMVFTKPSTAKSI